MDSDEETYVGEVKVVAAEIVKAADEDDDKDEDAEAKYIIAVAGRGRSRLARLHLVGGCWRAKQRCFKDYELVTEDPPDDKLYDRFCKSCWPKGFVTDFGDESGSSSSSRSTSRSRTPVCSD